MKKVIIYDYSKLLGRIKEKGYTQGEFARAIGKTPSTFTLRLSGDGNFTQTEMELACRVLDFDKSEIGTYFFTPRV
jgi:transcriptional regulator with XRE-family HTH domain